MFVEAATSRRLCRDGAVQSLGIAFDHLLAGPCLAPYIIYQCIYRNILILESLGTRRRNDLAVGHTARGTTGVPDRFLRCHGRCQQSVTVRPFSLLYSEPTVEVISLLVPYVSV